LILDIMMPKLDGLELLRRVRHHPKMGRVPVIIVSARADSIEKQRIFQLCQPDQISIDACMGKPFDPARLLQTVKDVLINHKEYLFEKQQNSTKPRTVKLVA